MRPRLSPILAIPLLAGCSWFHHDDPLPLTAAAFYAADPAAAPAPATQPTTPETAQTPVAPTPAPRPATRPTRIASTGSYLTIGGVLAEVNGVPIFASKVMQNIEPTLRKIAADLEARPFREEAKKKFDSQISELVYDELLYAAAQHNLGADDVKLAGLLTGDYRQKVIQASGGSVQQAKRDAADAGDDFEDMVTRANRRYMIGLFQERKIFPRVQVTTQDMKRFYRDHVDKDFTERAAVTARIIRVSPLAPAASGRAAALDRIKAIHHRVTDGHEDFAAVAASADNDDPGLRSAGGRLEVTANTLSFEQLEAALFRTEPGQITDVIDDGGAFFIARIDAKKGGAVQAFSDPAVQARIRRQLEETQRRLLVRQYEEELRKNAVIRQDPAMEATALELIAQCYPLWRTGQ